MKGRGIVAVVVGILAGLLLASTASAQRRVSLAAWQPELNLDLHAARAGVGYTTNRRVTLSGTVTSTIDGERYDAFHRITENGGQRVDLVVLPPNAVVVEQDYEAHTYVVELRRGHTLRFDTSVIARQNLNTVSEVRRGLRGAIIVDLATNPVAADAVVAAAATQAAEPPMSTMEMAGYGALAAAPPMFLLALFGAFRRRRRPEKIFMRRIIAAASAVDREAKRLGPAFDPLRDAAFASREEGTRLLRAHGDARAAKRRLKSIGGTGNKRFVELDTAERKALRELEILCDRLEDTAVSLASHDARHANAGDVEAALGSLGEELRTAISADEEARQVA